MHNKIYNLFEIWFWNICSAVYILCSFDKNMKKNLDEGNEMGLQPLVNLQKAFDLIDHNILLMRLECYRILFQK